MILPRGLAVLRFGTYRTSRHTYFYQVNRNLLQSSTSVPHTCILKFARLKSYKRNANKDLLPFRMINDCDDKKLNDDTFEKSVIDSSTNSTKKEVNANKWFHEINLK